MFGSIGGAAVRRVARATFFAVSGLVILITANAPAAAETRSLKIYHVHLREKSEIVYKRNGRFLPDGLKKLNWAMRDWRESKPTNMDPALFDILWEAYRQSGSRDYINVIGGYRSPGTNRKLRSRSSGVAEKSLHVQGKAVDFFIPDVPLRRVRDIGLKMQVGGVGYYPRSGSPFVHMDTGKGRHWPRLSRKELVSVFPKGNTIHVPSDGKPLPGYEMALASYNKRRASASVQIANASEGRSGGGRSLLAAIFGGGAEEAEDEAEASTAPAPARRAPASAEPERAIPEPQRAVPAREEPVQVAAVQPTRRPAAPTPPAAVRPATLPTGVAMPETAEFDTTSRRPTPPAAVPAETTAPTAEPAEQQVAALDLARVPMPTAAPGRLAGPAAAPALAEPATETVESSLVAALEAAAPTPASSGQLAYAVPMPSRRPPFEAILAGAATRPATDLVESTATSPAVEPVSALAALESVPVPTHAAAAPLQVAALPAPNEGPAPVAADVDSAMAALARDLEGNEAAAALAAALAPADAGPSPTDLDPAAASAGLSGKSGRVLNTSGPAPVAVSGNAVPRQQDIASRIEVATLVTSPEQRAEEGRFPRPNAEMLVVDVPISVMAAGFAPRSDVAASDRFSGSAVNFLPVRKLDQ